MVYHITVDIRQSCSPHFDLENIGPSNAWQVMGNTTLKLTMAGSGTGGTITYTDPQTGVTFAFTCGVHNYKHWGDIAIVHRGQSADAITSSYYEKAWGGTEDAARCAARWRTPSSASVTHGTGTFTFVYTETGENAKVNLLIMNQSSDTRSPIM